MQTKKKKQLISQLWKLRTKFDTIRNRKAFFNRWKNDAKFIARYFSIKIEEESPDERLSPVAKDCPTGKPERVWRLFLHAIYVFHKRK